MRRLALAALLASGCSLVLVPAAPPRRTPPVAARCGSRVPPVIDTIVSAYQIGLGVVAIAAASDGLLAGLGVLSIGIGVTFGYSSGVGFYRVARCRDERERFAGWAAEQPPSTVVGELGGPCGPPSSRWEAGSCRAPLECDERTRACAAPR